MFIRFFREHMTANEREREIERERERDREREEHSLGCGIFLGISTIG